LTVGIDPGLAIVGFGLIENDKRKLNVIDYGKILTPSELDISKRLEIIHIEMEKLFEMYKPDQVAIEKLFFNTNVTTAINVSRANGVILLSAAIRNIEIYEYTPLQVKQSVVGYGNANKQQVQQMVKNILKLQEIPKPDDVADAIAVAICHIHIQGFRSCIN